MTPAGYFLWNGVHWEQVSEAFADDPDVVALYPAPADDAAMQADAERYQWLRDASDHTIPPTPGVIRLDSNDCIEHLSGDDLDAAIDAQMRGESEA